MTNKVGCVILLVLGMFLVGLSLARAQVALDAGSQTVDAGIVSPAEGDEVGLVIEIVKNARGGNSKLVLAGILSLLMLGLARIREHTKIFSGKRGGALLVLVLGLAGYFSSALALPEVTISWSWLLTGITTVFVAVGGWRVIKDLVYGDKS